MTDIRAGVGYDIHPLVPGRPLVLGGIDIPFGRGLGGWSDADVLTHAVIEALLGAAALGDIGRHFPPGEEQYKDVSSIVLLERTVAMIKQGGWRINNIDATVVLEEPHLSKYIDRIRQKLSLTLDIDYGRVSVKAKTNAGLGAEGRGAGIATHAVALIEKV